MCTQINQADFTTVHHELGHIYYYLFYWNQPYIYRDGANPGFHEAVGDTISLSVQIPEHLFKIGLIDRLSNNTRKHNMFRSLKSHFHPGSFPGTLKFLTV